MFFGQLFKISEGKDLDVNLKIKIKNGVFTVAVTPGIADADIQPVFITGNALELDEGFIEAIKAPVQKAGLVVSNLEALESSLKEIEDDKKKEVDKAKKFKAASKPAPSKKSKPGKDESKPSEVSEASEDEESDNDEGEEVISETEQVPEPEKPSEPKELTIF